MQRDFARHPEIAEIQITNPTFVYGQLRSGTTKVQKLLTASGDFHYLPFLADVQPISDLWVQNGVRASPASPD